MTDYRRLTALVAGRVGIAHQSSQALLNPTGNTDRVLCHPAASPRATIPSCLYSRFHRLSYPHYLPANSPLHNADQHYLSPASTQHGFGRDAVSVYSRSRFT